MEKDLKEFSLPNLQEQEESDNLHNLETDSSGKSRSKTVNVQPEGTERETSSTHSLKAGGAYYTCSDYGRSRLNTGKEQYAFQLPLFDRREQQIYRRRIDNYGGLQSIDSKSELWTLDDSSPYYREKSKQHEIKSDLGIEIDINQRADTEPERDAAENTACITYKQDQDNQKLDVLSSAKYKTRVMGHTKTKSSIMKVMTTLVDYMEPHPILEQMMKCDMFRRSSLAEIMVSQGKNKPHLKKNRALLKFILARDEPALTKLKECLLRTNQELIVTLIEKSENDEEVDEITKEIKREANELMRPETMLIRDLMASMTLKINCRKKELYCFAYVKLGNKVCKAFFMKRMADLRPKHIDPSTYTVDIFLDIRTSEIEATKLYHVIIKGIRPTTKFESWDVPLLCVMLIKYCDVSLSVEQCLEWMVERPKKIAKCNEENFENKFKKLKKHILIIADAVQDEDLIRTIREELYQLENGVIPDSNRAYISDEILRSKEDVIEEVRDQSIETRTAIQTFREEVKIVGKQGTEIGNLILEKIDKILNKVEDGRPICRCPVPAISVKIVIETVSPKMGLVFSETVVRILNFENNIDDSAIRAATEEVRQTFKENDYTIIRSKVGCIKLYIQCSSVVSLLKFLRDYLNGTLDSFMKPLEKAARLLDGCSDFQLKTIMYEADFNNILTYLDVGQFDTSITNVGERSWENWTTSKAKTPVNELCDESAFESARLSSLQKISNENQNVYDTETKAKSNNNLPSRILRCKKEPNIVFGADSRKDMNSSQEIHQDARNKATKSHSIVNAAVRSMLYTDPFEAEETEEEDDDDEDDDYDYDIDYDDDDCDYVAETEEEDDDDEDDDYDYDIDYDDDDCDYVAETEEEEKHDDYDDDYDDCDCDIDELFRQHVCICDASTDTYALDDTGPTTVLLQLDRKMSCMFSETIKRYKQINIGEQSETEFVPRAEYVEYLDFETQPEFCNPHLRTLLWYYSNIILNVPVEAFPQINVCDVVLSHGLVSSDIDDQVTGCGKSGHELTQRHIFNELEQTMMLELLELNGEIDGKLHNMYRCTFDRLPTLSVSNYRSLKIFNDLLNESERVNNYISELKKNQECVILYDNEIDAVTINEHLLNHHVFPSSSLIQKLDEHVSNCDFDRLILNMVDTYIKYNALDPYKYINYVGCPLSVMSLRNVSISHSKLISLYQYIGRQKMLTEIDLGFLNCLDHYNSYFQCLGCALRLSQIDQLSVIRLRSIPLNECDFNTICLKQCEIVLDYSKSSFSHKNIQTLLKSLESAKLLKKIVLKNIRCSDHGDKCIGATINISLLKELQKLELIDMY